MELAAMRALVVLCSESGTQDITDSTRDRKREIEGIRDKIDRRDE